MTELGFQRKFNGTLPSFKNWTNYDIKRLHSFFYPTGIGYYNEDVIDQKYLYGYDINSAYAWALYNKKFPTDEKWDYDKVENYGSGKVVSVEELMNLDEGLVNFKFNTYECKIPGKYKTFFGKINSRDNTEREMIKKCINKKTGYTYYAAHLNTTDLRVFLKMYKVTGLKLCQYYKMNMDYLGDECKKLIEEVYDKKKLATDLDERQMYKDLLNKNMYGKLVAKNYKLSNMWGKSVYSKNTPIGMWVASYVRERMVDMLLKYINNVAYIDTDCLRMDIPLVEKTGNELGQFKCEYENVRIYCARFKVYVVYKNGVIIDQKHSGITRDLTAEEWYYLEKHGFVKIIDIDGREYTYFDKIHSNLDTDEYNISTFEYYLSQFGRIKKARQIRMIGPKEMARRKIERDKAEFLNKYSF